MEQTKGARLGQRALKNDDKIGETESLCVRGHICVREKGGDRVNRQEQDLQIAFFEWAEWNKGRYPELRLMHHIPNGGKRTKAEAAIFKAMGVKSGIPDVFLPAARGIYKGLYIEFKSKGEKPSKVQSEFIESLQIAGYFACVRDDLRSAIQTVERYLNLPQINLMYLILDKYGRETYDECRLADLQLEE